MGHAELIGAGMGGGIAYLWDPERRVASQIHRESVEVHDLEMGRDGEQNELLGLLREHAEVVCSPRAKEILAAWPASVADFVRVTALDSDAGAALLTREKERALEAHGVVLEV